MPISQDDLAHLLRRTEFAARPARLQQLGGLERAGAVDAIVGTANGVPAGQPGVPGFLTYQDDNRAYDQWVTMVQWWLDRMNGAGPYPSPFREKMTLFWHGHFTTSWWKVFNTKACVDQISMYRANALGNFTTLAQAMAVDPAMLVYLDNAQNDFRSPNQNFARELMELFLLGVGNYTENDVVGAARAWAGYTISESNKVLSSVYDWKKHDPTSATWPLLGVTKHWTGPAMIAHILTDATLRMISAKFIVRKLWEFFAYQNPAQAIVDALATTFVANNFSIAALMKALLNRDEFYSTTAKQGLVRSPVDYVVATLAHTGTTAADLDPQWYLENMGQELLIPPNVSGWKTNGYWINSSAWTGRAEFAAHARWKLRDRGLFNGFDKLAPADAVARAAQQFGCAPLSNTTTSAMVGYLNAQRAADKYGGWAEMVELIQMIMLAPEFHLA